MNRCTLLACSFAAILCLPAERAVADIYQFTDENGVVHLSNVGSSTPKGRRRIREQAGSRSEPSTQQAASPSSVRTLSPAERNIPEVYSDMINRACERHGVDPALVHAVVRVESGFNPFALSRKGAMGLMQLMPQTALDMNVRNSFNPSENIDGGVKYLRYLIDRYAGNLSLALAAYNSGETAVQKWGTIPPYPETRTYVEKILRLYNGPLNIASPGYTIYVGYGDDGALILTDDPSKHGDKKLNKKNGRRL